MENGKLEERWDGPEPARTQWGEGDPNGQSEEFSRFETKTWWAALVVIAEKDSEEGL